MSTDPGWYPDPYAQAEHRWWDGAQWTTATQSPSAAAPPPPPPLPVVPAQAGGYDSPASMLHEIAAAPTATAAATATAAPGSVATLAPPPYDFSSGTITGTGSGLKRSVPTPLVLGVVGAVVLAGGAYFLVGRGGSSAPRSVAAPVHSVVKAAAVPDDPITAASKILVQASDMPPGWQTLGAVHLGSTASADPTSAQLQACVAVPNQAHSDVESPGFTDGKQLYTSSYEKFDSPAAARKDFAPALGPAAVPCIKRALQSAIATKSPTSTNVIVEVQRFATKDVGDGAVTFHIEAGALTRGVPTMRSIVVAVATVGAQELSVTGISDGMTVSDALIDRLLTTMVARAKGEPTTHGVPSLPAGQTQAPTKRQNGETLNDADAAVRSTLRQAAITEETYFTDNVAYTKSLAVLTQQGFRPEPGVSVTINRVSDQGFCLTGQATGTTHRWTYDSLHGGVLKDTPCR